LAVVGTARADPGAGHRAEPAAGVPAIQDRNRRRGRSVITMAVAMAAASARPLTAKQDVSQHPTLPRQRFVRAWRTRRGRSCPLGARLGTDDTHGFGLRVEDDLSLAALQLAD